eukprot:3263648-Rhodomonas_salina.1
MFVPGRFSPYNFPFCDRSQLNSHLRAPRSSSRAFLPVASCGTFSLFMTGGNAWTRLPRNVRLQVRYPTILACGMSGTDEADDASRLASQACLSRLSVPSYRATHALVIFGTDIVQTGLMTFPSPEPRNTRNPLQTPASAVNRASRQLKLVRRSKHWAVQRGKHCVVKRIAGRASEEDKSLLHPGVIGQTCTLEHP